MNTLAEHANNENPVVAIIGAGQLGFLLCEAARELGIRTLVVTPDQDAPALTIADSSIVTDYRSPQLARQIADSADSVTFELEAVPDELLEALLALQQKGQVNVFPGIDVLRLLKNKARQKRWLLNQGFATADYIEISADQAIRRDFLADVSFPFVQKSQEGGYDGYGVQIIRSESELDRLWPAASIIETYLGDARELAVVVARSRTGETSAYPPVEMTVDQQRNILDMVVAPAPLERRICEQAERLALQVATRLNGVGVFAVEMFLAGDELLINEISPRVHNSGHHTLESCAASQFEQHMRAVSGMPLATTAMATSAVMKNILYEERLAPLMGTGPGRIAAGNEAVRVHWYGKKDVRPGRKMGHVTCVGVDTVSGDKMINETLSDLIRQ